MSFTLLKASKHTKRLYARLGEPVIYMPTRGTALPINAIITRQSQLGPSGVAINVADGEDSARIRKADIVLPTRGDKIVDAENTVYTIQDVDDNFNESEHEVQLRETG